MTRFYSALLTAMTAGAVALALSACNPNQNMNTAGTAGAVDTGQASAGAGTSQPGVMATPSSGNQQAGQFGAGATKSSPGATGANSSGSSQ